MAQGHSHIDPTGNAMLPSEQRRETSTDEYMVTSLSQVNWDEIARAMNALVEAARDVAEVLNKHKDDLPLTTTQREAIRVLRK